MHVEHLPLQAGNMDEKWRFLPLIISGDVICHVLFVRAPDSELRKPFAPLLL